MLFFSYVLFRSFIFGEEGGHILRYFKPAVAHAHTDQAAPCRVRSSPSSDDSLLVRAGTASVLDQPFVP